MSSKSTLHWRVQWVIERLDAKDPTLIDVNLSNVDLGDDGAMELARHVRPWHLHVRQLLLESNGIGEKGIDRLIVALRHLRGLMRLSLRDNCLGDNGVAELAARALPFMPGLRILDIAQNGAASKESHQIVARQVWNSRYTPYGLIERNGMGRTSLFSDEHDLYKSLPASVIQQLPMVNNGAMIRYIMDMRPSTDLAQTPQQWLEERHPLKCLHAARLFGFARDRPETLVAYERGVFGDLLSRDPEMVPPSVRALWENSEEAVTLTCQPMFAIDVCALILQFVDFGWEGLRFDWARGRLCGFV